MLQLLLLLLIFFLGVLIARQRIRFPKPMDQGFYDMIDFNIGKNVELYGRVFRIVNCDKFTRNFLNRMGIFVGDPLNYPPGYSKNEEKKVNSSQLLLLFFFFNNEYKKY